MSINYKRPFNGTLGAGVNTLYTSAAGIAQIRAVTVFNPTTETVVLKINLGGKQYLQKSIAANATVVISEIINQQLEQTEAMQAEGTGVNLILSVAEIV